jgi:hypothetical protein
MQGREQGPNTSLYVRNYSHEDKSLNNIATRSAINWLDGQCGPAQLRQSTVATLRDLSLRYFLKSHLRKSLNQS